MLSEMFDRLYEHSPLVSIQGECYRRLLIIIYKSYDARMKEAVFILISAWKV